LQENIIPARYETENQEKREMWVRAVATVVAVWCVSSVAVAAGYSEVWNPPESSGHTARPAKKTTGAGKVKPGVGAKAGSKHTASGQHGVKRAVSAPKSGVKPATHASVKKVAAGKTGHHDVVKGAGKPKSKAVVVAHNKKPRAPLTQAKPGQGKITNASLVQGRTAPSHPARVAAKPDRAAKPAADHTNAPTQAATVTAGAAGSTANPAMANSGSLPPILH
jgi:hypothetical protein